MPAPVITPLARIVALVLAAAALSSCERAQPQADAAQLTAESRAVVKTFATELQAALQESLAGGGPVQAISTCKEVAPAIAARLSREKGWTVGRTSLKLRNPDNAPDAWETARLDSMAQRLAAGTDPATLEEHKRTPHSFRYMKAIPIQPACLLCHGESLAPPLAATLDAAYPADRARGYKLGELRGAFTVTIPLD
ncbi:MAG: DUF3365 domain-containing protein [Akkermansiaceae bacterium]|nr:DUF3365 domain-containing protein [Akkermansiaceae bacterium]